MKISKENFTKIETNVKKFINDNNLQEVTVSTISRLHHLFCLSVREPDSMNIKTFIEKYKFNPDKDYFNDYYLNDNELNDKHFETAFKQILTKL